MPISKNQQEILDMLTKEFLTPKQIANRRQIHISAVYKTINKLKKKGLIYGNQRGGRKTPIYSHRGGRKSIRLHGEIYNLRFISTQTYTNLRKQRNSIEIDGNTIRLFTNSIIIYSNRYFTGANTDAAEAVAVKYWDIFFKQLEDRLKVNFLQIKRVKQHYAELNNELAVDANKRKEQIKIKGKDGKTWLLTDNSFKLNELETIHPELAKEDMDKIKPFFDDLRENPTKLSEVMDVIKQLALHNKETAAGLNAVVQLLKPKEVKENEQNKTIPDYIN